MLINGYLKPVGALGKGATGIVFLAIATPSPTIHHHLLHHHHHHHQSDSPSRDHELLPTAMAEMHPTVDMHAGHGFSSRKASIATPPSTHEMYFGVGTDGEGQFDLKDTSNSKSESESAVSASMEEMECLNQAAFGSDRGMYPEVEVSDDGADRIPSKVNHAISSRGSSCADNLFALKAFRRSRDEDLERSRNEEQVLSSFGPHPCLPRLHSAFDFADFRFLVLDFCAGGDLASLARSLPRRRFSPSAIRFYAAEIVLALHHLHNHGIVYRDLKPENILLSSDGHVVLTDFDLSASLPPKEHPFPFPSSSPSPSPSPSPSSSLSSSSSSDSSCSSSYFSAFSPLSPSSSPISASFAYDSTPAFASSFVGTEEYIAPEIIGGDGHEFAVDWWGLGILLYEMAYGKTPFRGKTRAETFHNILHKEVKFPWSFRSNRPRGTTLLLRDLIQRLLVKEPNRRLGFLAGLDEFKSHPFFAGIRWAEVCNVSRPPFIPYTTTFMPSCEDNVPGFDLMSHLIKVECARSESRARKLVRDARRRRPM